MFTDLHLKLRQLNYEPVCFLPEGDFHLKCSFKFEHRLFNRPESREVDMMLGCESFWESDAHSNSIMRIDKFPQIRLVFAS